MTTCYDCDCDCDCLEEDACKICRKKVCDREPCLRNVSQIIEEIGWDGDVFYETVCHDCIRSNGKKGIIYETEHGGHYFI